MFVARLDTDFQQLRLLPGARIIRSDVDGPLYLAGDAQLGPDVVAGRYNGLSSHACIMGATIGSFCCFGARVAVNPYQHPIGWLSSHGFQFFDGGFNFVQEYREFDKIDEPYQAPVTIGSDVWMGHNSIVMEGVTICDGAVIGAGAIVTRDVPPYAVVAGVPSVVKRFRFDDRTIERLLCARWWDMELRDLDGLPFDRVDRCLDMIEERQHGKSRPRMGQ